MTVFLAIGLPARAQNKAPELGYAYPPVVRSGTLTNVMLGGYDLTTDAEWFVHDDRVTLECTGQLGGHVVPPPPYWFGERARSTAFPIPREIPAAITVAADLKTGWVHYQVANANGSSSTARLFVSDQLEVLESRDRDRPQQLNQLPIAVSGRLECIAEIDRYRIVPQQDGPITVELFARRFGSDFNGQLTVLDPDGQVVADHADTEGLDLIVTFDAVAGRGYDLDLQDIDHRGNRAYVYRLAFRYGTPNLPAVDDSSATSATTTSAATPKPATTTKPATTMRRNFRFTPEQPEIVDEFTALKGQVWRIDAQSRALGTRLDVMLAVQNADGKQLAANDDLPGTPDAGLEFKVPADGTYRCVISDLSGESFSAESVFRLQRVLREPDFELTVPQQLNIVAEATATLAIKAVRHAGFSEPIAIRLTGLPEGITVPDALQIPAGKNDLKVVLTPTDVAGTPAALIQVIGESSREGQTLVRTASAPAIGNLCPRDPNVERVARVLLSTTLKPKFNVQLVDKNRQRAVHRGTTYPAPFVIDRDEGFAGTIRLTMAARQGRHRQGITAPTVEVPAGRREISFPCFMPQWLETDRTTRMVAMGIAEQQDATGRVRQITRPADARITMILEGALLTIDHDAPELTARAGDVIQVPITLRRSAKLTGPISLLCRVPPELSNLISLPPTTLDANTSQAKLRIETSQHPRLNGRWRVDLIAKGGSQELPVIAQTELTIEFR